MFGHLFPDSRTLTNSVRSYRLLHDFLMDSDFYQDSDSSNSVGEYIECPSPATSQRVRDMSPQLSTRYDEQDVYHGGRACSRIGGGARQVGMVIENRIEVNFCRTVHKFHAIFPPRFILLHTDYFVRLLFHYSISISL